MLIANQRGIVPGTVVAVRPVGVLFMEDDGGQDEKILAVPVSKLTKMYDNVKDIGDMQPIQVERVKHFFTHYKDLEPGKWAKISHVGNAAEARQVITDSIAAYESAEATPKIRLLTIAPLLAEAIRRIADESSVSSLFD